MTCLFYHGIFWVWNQEYSGVKLTEVIWWLARSTKAKLL